MHLSRSLLVLIVYALLLPTLATAQDSETTTVGGYGEVHYTNPTGPDSPGTVNVARFVVYLAHGFNEKLSLRSELEVEDTKVEGGEEGVYGTFVAGDEYFAGTVDGRNAKALLESGEVGGEALSLHREHPVARQ